MADIASITMLLPLNNITNYLIKHISMKENCVLYINSMGYSYDIPADKLLDTGSKQKVSILLL